MIVLLVPIVYSCNPPECITITFKEETTKGRYYFYWGDNWGNTTTGGFDDSGGQPFSGEVTEKEFNDYQIGDRYCLD